VGFFPVIVVEENERRQGRHGRISEEAVFFMKGTCEVYDGEHSLRDRVLATAVEDDVILIAILVSAIDGGDTHVEGFESLHR
jgi:hypothetical protein